MKRPVVTLSFLTTCLLLSIPHAANAQGKIASDPNTLGAKAASAKSDVDLRLVQKITYDSGYKRLHDIVDDLCLVTDVDILCGQNKKDWKVRDIPVVVCVKDLPLGKLLRAIADATHTIFSSETIGDNPEKSYRIYRRSADQDNIDTFAQKKHDYSLEDAVWQWDALAAYGNSGEPAPDDPSLRQTWVMARMIAGLGSDSKNKLLNGDTLTLRGTDPVDHAYMAEYYRLICEEAYNPSQTAYPPFEEVEDTPLGIKLVDNGVEAEIRVLFGPAIQRRPTSPNDGAFTSFSIISGLPYAGPLQDKITDLPPHPKATPIPSLEDDIANPRMILHCNGQPNDTTSHSFLTTKITLEKSRSATDLTFAKAIRAIAQAGQCNIVTEDFASHKSQSFQRIDGILSAQHEDTILNLLNKPNGSTWFVSEDGKLVVGWQTGRRQTWRDHHANILPEEYLNGLRAKLNGDGVELDDVVHLSNLLETSAKEWMVYTDDFQDLYQWNLDPA